MRATKILKAALGTCLGAMVVVGVGAAAARLQAQKEAQLCMFHVSSCAGSECTVTCANYDSHTSPFCNSSTLCCNCLL